MIYWIALIAVQIFYGVSHVFSFELMRNLDPYLWTLLRASLAALVLRLILAWRPPSAAERAREPKRHTFVWVALLGVTLTQILFMIGLAHSTPTETGLIIAITPIWTYVFSCWLRHESLHLRQGVGIAFAAAGILLLRFRPGSQVNYVLLINSVVYGAYLAFAWPHMRGLKPLHLMSRLFDWGTLMLLPIIGVAVYVGAVNVDTWQTLKIPEVWINIAFLILFATVGTYSLNAYSAKHLPASVIAVAATLQPLVAAITDHLLTGRAYDTTLKLSAALIVPGVVMTSWRKN